MPASDRQWGMEASHPRRAGVVRHLAWWPWAFAAALSILAWLVGLASYEAPPYPQTFRASGAFVVITLMVLALGIPTSIVAAFLRSLGSMVAVAGSVALVLASLPQDAILFVGNVGGGGICIDPRDACLVTWPGRLFPLLAELACLAAGVVLEVRLRRRHRPAGKPLPERAPAQRDRQDVG